MEKDKIFVHCGDEWHLVISLGYYSIKMIDKDCDFMKNCGITSSFKIRTFGLSYFQIFALFRILFRVYFETTKSVNIDSMFKNSC